MTDPLEMDITTVMGNARIQFVKGQLEDDGPLIGFFVATFIIEPALRLGGIESESNMTIMVPVLGEPRDTSYDKVEMRAAQSLPAALRQIADQVEDLVAKTYD